MGVFVWRTWFQAKLTRDENGERGASLVEYLLLVSLIAMAVIGAIVFLGGSLDTEFKEAGTRLSSGH